MIKIKSDIQVIEEGEKLLFYNTDTRQILVAMKITDKQTFNLEEFRYIAYYYQTLEEIVSGKYKQIILSLYKRNPEFFETVNQEYMEQALIQNDIELTIDKNLFFLTFEYNTINQLKQKDVIFWGESEVTRLLAESLHSLAKSIIIYTTKGRENKIGYPKGVVLKEWSETQSDISNNKTIHVVYENEFSNEQLRCLNENIDNKGSVLNYKATVNELIIGPLVIGDETCSYDDYTMQYPSTTGLLSKSIAYISTGLINRLLYFIILDSLPYIAEDAQLPINSVFRMNTYTLALDTHKIFKGVSTNESDSKKHFKKV